jgi:hypothetical protein
MPREGAKEAKAKHFQLFLSFATFAAFARHKVLTESGKGALSSADA